MTRCAAIVPSWALLVLLAASPSRAGEPAGLKKVIDLDAKDELLASVVDRIRTLTGENTVLGTEKHGKDLWKTKTRA
jgi:hypothetical protein